jgi:hypothetical protein
MRPRLECLEVVMARCNDCNKFVGVEELDAEVDAMEIDPHGTVSCSVRIENGCSECSTPMREASFDIEVDHGEDVKDHLGEGHELHVEDESCDRDQRTEGTGRGTKTFYGFSLCYVIRCSCSGDVERDPNSVTAVPEFEFHGEYCDYVQASSMEDM